MLGFLNKLAIFGALLSLLSGCYVLKQGYQLHYQLHEQRSPISEYLKSATPKQKTKLHFLSEVMEYARRQGLDNDGSYEHVVDNKQKYISYLVYAAYPYQYKSKTWWAPFVGTVPYLGFFDENDQKELAVDLEQEGFEVYKAVAGGFSSLGWWDDPIYTQMLRRDKIDLAMLIFHELVHTTFWIKGSVKLNENLAEFIGLKLTKEFFGKRNRKELITELNQRMSDHNLYLEWLRNKKDRLKDFLNDPKKTKVEKKSFKDRLYNEMNTQLPSFKTKKFNYLIRKKWNNASMIAASLYSPDTKKFEILYRCSNPKNAGHFLKILKEKLNTNPEVSTQNICP